MNLGQELWEKAKRIIPGGNGLLSKRPERYLPELWPTYFSECNGVNVVGIDQKVYVDMAQMAVGSAILGYANEELTDAVCATARKGVNCTLNCPEEVELAELLLELNPFAGGVKFARTGAEAMSMAIRIGRSATERTKVLFSGYHGWSDWYLAANLGGDGLADHLIPGLRPSGVPSGLKDTAVPFLYNDVENFEEIIGQHSDVGVICVEGARYDLPTPEFIEVIQFHAKRLGAIILLDEITSGWRLTDGGVYKTNGFDPDVVVYGKAMGGGYAISSVVGREEVMQAAQNSFISSTMWTERVGFVAALTTIRILQRERGWLHLGHIGSQIGRGWETLAKQHGLRLRVTEFKPLVTFQLDYHDQNDALITLFTREMLDRGYLAAPSVYVSLSHSEKIVEQYLNAVDEVFSILADTIEARNVSDALHSPHRSDAFTRLT